MRAAGVETLFDIEALNVVGALEVCTKIPQGLRMARCLRQEAMHRQTRVAVLIDTPGFNLPFARQLKNAGLRVVYYVSPQIWAWRQGRVHKIARRVDKMLTLFPFEVPFYTGAGVDAEYVGHPLIDRLQHLPPPQQTLEESYRRELGERFAVVFNNQNRIAQISEMLQCMDQLTVITLMQANTGFIQNIEHTHQLRSDLCG